MIGNLRERYGNNSLIGIFLIIMLFTFAGNEVFRLVIVQVPGADEAFPCSLLSRPENTANNQSLIGRRVIQSDPPPISLQVRTSNLPAADDQQFVIRILIINESLGTIPIIYSPDEVIIGNNNTSGLGVVFNPPVNIFLPGVNLRNDPATYPEDRIRLMGPQQRCIHKITLDRNQLAGSITNDSTVQAYYLGTNAGTVPAANPTPIYPDQGLYTGQVTSPVVPIAAGAP
ncbi:MAG: hypothetical protein AAFV33_27745 [Chloroflexota bacterium]